MQTIVDGANSRDVIYFQDCSFNFIHYYYFFFVFFFAHDLGHVIDLRRNVDCAEYREALVLTEVQNLSSYGSCSLAHLCSGNLTKKNNGPLRAEYEKHMDNFPSVEKGHEYINQQEFTAKKFGVNATKVDHVFICMN